MSGSFKIEKNNWMGGVLKNAVGIRLSDAIQRWDVPDDAWRGRSDGYQIEPGDKVSVRERYSGQSGQPGRTLGQGSVVVDSPLHNQDFRGRSAQLRVSPGSALLVESSRAQRAVHFSNPTFSLTHVSKTLSGLAAAVRAAPLVWAGAVALGPVKMGLLTATVLFSKEAGRGSDLPVRGRMGQDSVAPFMHASVPTAQPPGPRIETVPDDAKRRQEYFSPNERPLRLPEVFQGPAIPGFNVIDPDLVPNEPFGGEQLVQDVKASGGFQSWTLKPEDFFYLSRAKTGEGLAKDGAASTQEPVDAVRMGFMPQDFQWLRSAGESGWRTESARAEQIGSLLLNMPEQAKNEALRYARHLARQPEGKKLFNYWIGDHDAYGYLNTLVHRNGGRISELDAWLSDVLLDGQTLTQSIEHLIADPKGWAADRAYLTPVIAPNIKQWSARNLEVIGRVASGQTEAHIASVLSMDLNHVRVQVYKLIDKAGGYSRQDVEARYTGGLAQLASDALARMTAPKIAPSRLDQLTAYQVNILAERLSDVPAQVVAQRRGLQPNSYRAEIARIHKKLGIPKDIDLKTLAISDEGVFLEHLRARVPTAEEVFQALDKTPINVLEDLLARLEGRSVPQIAAARAQPHIEIRKNFQGVAQRLNGKVLDIPELMRPAFKEGESAANFVRRVLETKRA